MVSQIKVNEIIKQSGSTITIGESGDTVSIPSGCTIANSGTATGFSENMTPIFLATASTSQSNLSDNTTTLRIFNSEIFDSNSAYDTSTGLFTVPTTGKYLINAGINLDGGGDSNSSEITMSLSVNSDVDDNGATFLKFTSAVCNRWDANLTQVRTLTANDTVGVYGRMNTSGGVWHMYGGTNINYFGAFKIIE